MKLTILHIFGFTLLARNTLGESGQSLFVADVVPGGPIYSAPFETLDFTTLPIKGLSFPYSLTFNPVDGKLYWSDVGLSQILRSSPDGSNVEVLIERVYSEGIAVDQVSQHIFWGDGNANNIGRAFLNGTGQEVILNNVQGPGGIVIDELASHIYWISRGDYDKKPPPKIERANTDGSGRFTLVNKDLAEPQSLDIDFKDKKMYWTDIGSNTLECSDLFGNNRQVLLEEDPSRVTLFPVGIALRGDFIYWTSWQIRSLVRLNKNGLEPPELVGTVDLAQAGGIYVPEVVEDVNCQLDCQNEAPCRQLTEGYECVCPRGFLGENCEIEITGETTCDDQPCQNGGRCIQERDSYSCECRGGYLGTMCEMTPYLIIADRNGGAIYTAPMDDLNSFNPVPLPEPGQGIPAAPVAVDFDPIEMHMYWTDLSHGSINRISLKGDNYESLIVNGGDLFGLALNLKSRTMYWTDNSTNTINMANMDGSNEIVVVQDQLQDPIDIEVDDAGQLIYWTDVGAGKIERANLDGSNRDVLVDNNLEKPYGITIDYEDDTLFWCDAILNQIEKLNLMTGVRSLVADEINIADISPFDLIEYGELIIWTDWALSSLAQIGKDGQNANVVGPQLSNRPSGIHLVEGSDNSCASNPCLNQGRCRQLTRGYQCVCPASYTGSNCELESDGSCLSNPCVNGICQQRSQGYTCDCNSGYSGISCNTEDMIFVADQFLGMIFRASFPDVAGTFETILLNELIGQPTSLAIDQQDQMLYWTDIADGSIGRSHLNGSGQEVFLDGLSEPMGLAISDMTRKIFWISSGMKIEASSLDNSNRQTILTNLNSAQDMAVDSTQGHLYWTSAGDQPKIERVQEDGTGRTTIIDTDMVNPTGLALDIRRSQIYWSDAGKNTMETSKLDGSNRQTLADLSQLADLDPFNVAIYGDFMYWTDRNLDNFGVIQRYLGIVNTVGQKVLTRASGLAIYTDSNIVGCTETEFECSSDGECVSSSWVCNGIENCKDGSDETQYLCGYTTKAPITYPKGFCPEDTTTHQNDVQITWESTLAGETVYSSKKCPLTTRNAKSPLANRTCLSTDNQSGAEWDVPMEANCGPMENKLDITDLTEVEVDPDNAGEVATILANVTKDLEVDDISEVADIMSDLTTVDSEDPEVTTSVVGICNNILTATDGTEIDDNDTYLKILEALDDQISRSTRLGHIINPIVESNLAVTVTSVDPQQASNTGLTFGMRQNNGTAFRPGDLTTGESNDMEATRTSLMLPPSLFGRASDNGNVGVGITVHNSDTLFPTNMQNGQTLIGDIIGAEIAGISDLTNIDPPVEIEISAPGDYPGTCVFWDFDVSGWSSEGCEYVGRSAAGNMRCQCNHLTNFAVIADHENPVIQGSIEDITQYTDNGLPTASVQWNEPTATDNSGSVTLTANYNPGDDFPIGETIVTYTAMDPSGNQAMIQFSVTVIDNESPRLVSGCPEENIETFTDTLSSEVTWSEPRFRDNSGQKVELTSNHTSPFVFKVGEHEVVYYAEDTYGNTADCTINIIVTAACLESTVILRMQNYSWPVTPAEEQEVYSNERCDVQTEDRGKGIAVRDCKKKFDETGTHEGSEWSEATYNGCGEADEEPDLEDLAETPVVENNVENVAEALVNVTEELEAPTTEDIDNLADTLINIVGVETETPEVTQEVTTLVVNLLDNLVTAADDSSDDKEPDEDENMSTAPRFLDILKAFEEQVTTATGLEKSLESVEPNIILTTTTTKPNVGISFTVAKSEDKVGDEEEEGFREEDVGIDKEVPEEEVRSSISLPASLFNTGETDIKCYSNENGTDYRGKTSFTVNGITCQKWTSQTPHNHTWTTENYPDSGLGDHNYCRNPGGERTGAWCLTIDPNTAWEYCHIGEPQELCEGTIIGVSFVVHKSDILFATNSTNQTRIVGGDIVSAIVTGIDDVSNLADPVVLEFTTQGENPQCVFWDFEILDWSSKGCYVENEIMTKNMRRRVICHCNHLTNFAVLVDYSPSTHIILDIVSKIGCGLSMISLLLTLIIFIAFKKLRTGAQATPRRILIQLCISLFLLYLVFLVGIDRKNTGGGCVFVAVLLHFFTLASMMWMGVEAHNLYLNVVRVFDVRTERFVLKASLIAWGIPLVVTAIALGAAFSHYNHQNYCFVKPGPPLYFGVILPVGIILLHNLVMFSLVMYSLCKANLGGNVTHQSKARKISQRLQNAFVISILMGLTWVFGFFAIEDAAFTFSLIFCLCNSFQGVVIFILFCLRQDDVRRVLRPYYRRVCCIPEGGHGTETGSTGVSSSATKSQSKSPYSDTDFSATPSPKMVEASNDYAGVAGDAPKYESGDLKTEEPQYASADLPAEYEKTISKSKPQDTDAADEKDASKGVESAEEAKEAMPATPEEITANSSPLYESTILEMDTKKSPPAPASASEEQTTTPLLQPTEFDKGTDGSKSASEGVYANESFEMETLPAKEEDTAIKDARIELE